MNIKLALILVLSSLAVVFVAQNTAEVEIGFLFWRASIPSSMLIFCTLMLGFLVGWFLQDYLRYRKYKNRTFYSRE